jgi:hypothetical protein
MKDQLRLQEIVDSLKQFEGRRVREMKYVDGSLLMIHTDKG